MESFEEYEELGLTKNESKVYEVLLEFGKLSAGDISSKSKVPYGRIYDVLNSLINKGFVSVIPEKTKKFALADPANLTEIIEKREQALARVKEKVTEIKKFYDIKGKNPVAMMLGKAGFYKIAKETKQPDKYQYNIKWSSEYREDWDRHTREMLRKKIDLKTLARYDKETEKNIKQWGNAKKIMRKFPNEGFACSIIDDEEVMLGLIKSNVTLLIKDKAFAKVMKRLFIDSYNCAEKME